MSVQLQSRFVRFGARWARLALVVLVNTAVVTAGCSEWWSEDTSCSEVEVSNLQPEGDAAASVDGEVDADADAAWRDGASDDGGDAGVGDGGDGGIDGGGDAGAMDGGDAGADDGGDAGADDGGDAGADDGGDAGADDGGDAGTDGGGDAGVDGGGDAGAVGCALPCHGSDLNAAPPAGLGGETQTSEGPVGAHQQHLPTSSWHHVVECTQCHVVPAKPKDPAVPTHMNGNVDLIWGPIAKKGTFYFAQLTCTGTWCHGGWLKTDPPGKTTNRVPLWTKVDGTQAVCGKSCHVTPPGGGHPKSNACPACHTTVIDTFKPGDPPTVTWVDANLHINGVVDVYDLNCTSCHGNPLTGSPAPPVGANGEKDTTEPAVGAHAQHLTPTDWHRDVECTDCHELPLSTMHSNGVVDFSWGGPSAADGASPLFEGKTVSCTGVYCHGGTLLPGGTLTTPQWNKVDGTQAACGTCHGLPPSAPHPQTTDCAKCHPAVISACPDNNPANCLFQPDVSPSQSYKLHINGIVDVVGGVCNSCHGAPPANGTHVTHAGGADMPTKYGSLEPRANASSYAFNCGFCHPLDVSKHMNGKLEVELYDPAAPAVPVDPSAPGDRRTVKRENPAAAYVPGLTNYSGDVHTFTDGSCAKVYCHSAEAPLVASVPFPANVVPPTFSWQAVTPFYDVTANQCCNGTPDDYPDFTITVTRAYATPKWVGETHVGPDKCAHCHGYPPRAEPPNNAGAGQGHAWMDNGFEDGHFFNMAAGWPIQCRRCHAGTVAGYLPAGEWSYSASDNKIAFQQPMPIASFELHVNGKKDVAFDYSPNGCDAVNADLPYMPSIGVPCLKTATFDPATRTCANVECHLLQTKVTWGAPYRNLWGQPECNACHQY